MKCMECGATVKKGVTTSVSEFGECVVIVRMCHATNVRNVMKLSIQQTL